MKFSNYLLLFCFLVFISSCDDDSSTSPAKGVIRGIVIDQQTHQPVEYCTISTEPPTESVFTDEDGKFQINQSLEGNYQIIVEKDGYFKKSINVTVLNGQTSSAQVQISKIVDTNNPPSPPIILSPSDGVLYENSSINFTWTESIDIDEDEVKYNLYLSESNPPNSIAKNLISFTTTNLNFTSKEEKTYYCRVEAIDSEGNRALSSIITFKVKVKKDVIIGDSDLIFYLDFENDYPIDKSSSNLQPKEVTNVVYKDDRHGLSKGAADFNGSSSYILYDDNEILDLDDKPFTISIWFKPGIGYGKDAVNYIDIFSKIQEGNGSNTSFIYGISPTGYIKSSNYKKSGGSIESVGKIKIAVDKWSNLVIVGDGANTSFYVNGVFDHIVMGTGLPNPSSTSACIGARYNLWSAFRGSIDELRIYNKAFNSQEIFELYQE